MADNESSGASGSSKKKRARYNNSFRSEWSSQFECIRASRLGESHAFCQVCASDFKVTHGGINDVRKHLNTEKHVKCAKCLESTSKAVFDKFKVSTGNHTDNVTKAELLMQGFVIEHNLPIAVCDHFTKLVKNMFPDSRIAKDFSASRTKSTHLIYEIAETSCESICKQLERTGSGVEPLTDSSCRPTSTSTCSSGEVPKAKDDPEKWYSLATDGSSDEEDKFFSSIIDSLESRRGSHVIS